MTEPDDDPKPTVREGGSERRKTVPTAMSPEAMPYLPRGTLVGRYVVLDVIGEGGMGVVYGAYDPELDRKVAIKLLQAGPAGGSSSGDQAWLLREAQALARLAHPNVVAVHDVGSLPGDRVFVAMELVDGVTLRAWLKAEPRGWREVVRVMLAAGAGLAAAHAAGLVHRDFKPENVIVGNDGRVRVMDFGLARLHPDEPAAPARRDSDLRVEARSPLSSELTVAGTVVGTPAYMAPEIYEGHAADARTDQFGFGVTLYEALFGARPYAKDELRAPSSTVKPKPPADTKVPAAIQRVVLRATAIANAERFPSMSELLAALAVDPTANRRRALIGAAAVVVAGGGVAAVLAVSAARVQPCQGIDRRLVGVWDAPTKQAIRAGFAATKLAFAATAYDALEHALDGYAATWTSTAVESCRATRVRGDQTEAISTLRQTCLDQRLDELRALTGLLVAPTPSAVQKGDAIAAELVPVATCSNVAALQEPLQPRPEIRARLPALIKMLADAHASFIAGQYLATLTATATCQRLAKELGYEPAEAEAAFLRGGALMASQNFVEAAAALEEATFTAVAGRRRDIVANGALGLAMLSIQGLDKPGEARIWLALAKAAAKGEGVAPELEWHELETEGIVSALVGDLPTALAVEAKALAVNARMHGPQSPLLWEDESTLATTMMRASQYRTAIMHLEHALALRRQVVGDQHADIALLLSNLALAYGHVDDPRARATYERALALRVKLFGKDSPILAPTLSNFADMLKRHGSAAEALPMATRAVELAAIFPGKDHRTYHEITTNLGEELAALGRRKEARALLDELIALETKTHSVTLPTTLTSRSELALDEHDWSEAAAFAERAIAAFEAAGGADDPELWQPLTDLGLAKLELGQAAEAKPLLDRALAIAGALQVDELDLARTRAARARL